MSNKLTLKQLPTAQNLFARNLPTTPVETAIPAIRRMFSRHVPLRHWSYSMPIVDEYEGGLRRFAVMAFVEDKHGEGGRKHHTSSNSGGGTTTNARSVNKTFVKCPLTSIAEAAYKLVNPEYIHMKRLKSVEKGVLHPFADVSFFATYQGVSELSQLVEENECGCIYDASVRLQKACYEELQLVDPKKDMIQTPIDEDDPLDNMINGIGKKADTLLRQEEGAEYEKTRHLRGYIILAYKTYEDMYNRAFVQSWKTWTGVRFICMALPRQLDLRRISFYRQLSNTSEFKYVLIIEITNLMLFAADTLNLMDRIRQRLCGYVGIYREVDFKLDPVTAQHLNLETDFKPPPGKPSISISRYASKNTLIDLDEDTARARLQKILNQRDSMGGGVTPSETPMSGGSGSPVSEHHRKQPVSKVASNESADTTGTLDRKSGAAGGRTCRGDSLASVESGGNGLSNSKSSSFKRGQQQQQAQQPQRSKSKPPQRMPSSGSDADNTSSQVSPPSDADKQQQGTAAGGRDVPPSQQQQQAPKAKERKSVTHQLSAEESRKGSLSPLERTAAAVASKPAVRLAGKKPSKTQNYW